MSFPIRTKQLTDYIYNPTNPASEDDIRIVVDDSIQEVKDIVINTLESVTDGNSGMDNVGMTPIAGITATTPQGALEGLKTYIDVSVSEVVAGEFPSFTANNLPIEDTGNYYPSNNVEDALQSVGNTIADIPNQTYITNKATIVALNAVASGSPKGVYATLALLQAAFPTGNTNIYIVTADGNWYFWSGSAWTSGGAYQTTGIADGSITDYMLSGTSYIALKERSSLQMSDVTRITNNAFVNYLTGELSGFNASFFATDYIELIVGEKYQVASSNEQMAFYDENKVYVSGNIILNGLFNDVPVPVGVKYARFSCRVANKTNFLVYNRAEFFSGNYDKTIAITKYKNEITVNEVKNEIVRTVGATGKNFTTLFDANNACSDGSPTKKYKIIIDAGTYTYAGEISLNPHIKLIGVDREKCIIRGEFPNAEPKANIEQFSTLKIDYTNQLENLTITCKNMRYPIHDDGGQKDIVRNVTNCTIEHLGNDGARTAQADPTIWTSEAAYGMGVRSGNIAYFKNCTFKSNFIPWSVHNNVLFDKPAYIEHENCDFILGSVPVGVFAYGLRIQSDGSLTKDRIIFKGCRSNAPILLQDNWLGAVNTNHVEWSVEGHSNDLSFVSEFTTGQMDVTKFNDEVRKAKATVAITQGQLCCWDVKIGEVRVMLSSDDISIFAGIAIETVLIGEQVILKYDGYMYKKWITTAYSSVLGTFFGVGVDGKIAPVTKDKAVLVGMGTDTLIFKFI